MKKITKSILGVFIILLSSTVIQAAPVNVVVTFGQKIGGSGPCVSNGICTAVASGNLNPAGTHGVFSVNPLNTDYLLLTFSMTELQANQPDQAAAMLNIAANSLHYFFSSPYLLTTPLYAPLGLYPAASIQPVSIVTITISGDIVTMHINYEHN